MKKRKVYDRYKNQEYKSKKGNRVIVARENAERLQLTIINPDNEFSQLHLMERDDFLKRVAGGELIYVKSGLYNADYSEL